MQWVDALGAGPPVAPAGERLLARWGEPHRRYHDRQHLAEVLQALRLLADGDVPLAVLLAAYWHDAVYDPRAPDNEARSAELAAQELPGVGVPDDVVAEVVRLVLLTLTHAPDPDDAPGALLSDADLAVLAAPPARYAAYVQGVREEYGHLDDGAFRRGRADVLRTLAARPRLFTTAEGSRRWEPAARRNLRDELAALGAAPPP